MGGCVAIQRLVSKKPRLMTMSGVWVNAEIKNLGMQKLWRIGLSRNGRKKDFLCTDNQRWFVRGGAGPRSMTERETTELLFGTRLAYAFHEFSGLQKTGPASFGIAHGFTFGDGSRQKHGSVARFDGEKDQDLLRYFPATEVRRYGSRTQVGRLPLYFKDLPPLDEAPAYLYGWLAGYFAADGCVSKDGQVILSSASAENLEFVRILGNRLGVGTYGIKSQRRIGFGREETDLYQITFINSTLAPKFFILSKHRERFVSALKSKRQERERKGWVVSYWKKLI